MSRSSPLGTHRTSPYPIRLTPKRRSSKPCPWWLEWSGRCEYDGEWGERRTSILITLKALTYEPTGGIVAAPTTSLPERIGGVRNWDYRYLLGAGRDIDNHRPDRSGYTRRGPRMARLALPRRCRRSRGPADHVRRGRRAPAAPSSRWTGSPDYEGSRPVRVGNAASEQVQLDVYGEVMDAFYTARGARPRSSDDAWQLLAHLLEFLESAWRQPDEGIWEVRGPSRHFTHSKVMAWVAFDRAVRTNETSYGLDRPRRALAGSPRRDPRRCLPERLQPGARGVLSVVRRRSGSTRASS